MTAPYPLRHSLRAALFGGSVLLGLPLLAAAEIGISEYLEGNGNAGLRRIHQVQGNAASSPLLGQQVSVEAVVVADFQDATQLKGFFVQTPDDQVDADPLTSEGLFVYDGGNGVAVQVGDRLQVSGEVREFNGLTQLAGALEVRVLARDQALPAAAAVQLPLPSADYLERHEGMAVFLPQPLTVTEVYNLGRYGEVLLASGGRLMTPTNQVPPGAPALALQARNAFNQLLLDDGRGGQNPEPIRYPAPELSAFDSLRVGSQATGIRGVLDYAAGRYRVQPLATPDFLPSNPRPAEPQNLEGQVRVASFNVLNYFNGDGLGGGFPTSRGAHTAEEFQRQRAKLIAAILASRADVVGLMEIENDGYAPTSAIADLVAGLNAALPRGQRFAFVNPGVDRLGSDEIAVGLIYRRDRILPHKAAAILDSQVDPRFDDSKNRPALAQTFRQRDSGERLTLAVNHLKSKGSSCAEAGDPDRGDGQGHCNLTRARAAQALVEWLATDPTRSRDPDYLILGDLNAYAQEDPIALIRAAGYSDLVARFAEAGQG